MKNQKNNTHELGRFGQANINLSDGTLSFESEDFSFGGNRMPITISHSYDGKIGGVQYTSNSDVGIKTADFSKMKLGLGYKLNVMQSIVEDGENFVYVNESGEEIILKPTDTDNVYKSSEDDGEIEYDKVSRIMKNGDEFLFDEKGRLVKISDEHNNKNEFVYVDDKLLKVIDGANREFVFTYNSDGFLESITAPDNTQILYGYDNNLLSTVFYPDMKRALITYTNRKPTAVTLYDGENPVYRVEYTYSDSAVTKVIEYGYKNGSAQKGITKTFAYSPEAGRTVVTSSDSSLDTVYVFNNDGEIVSEYTMSNDFYKKPLADGQGITTVNNKIEGHNFENYSQNWQLNSQASSAMTIEVIEDEKIAKYGKNYLRMSSNNPNLIAGGICQMSSMTDDDYTFSAYLRVVSGFEGENDGAYLCVYEENRDFLVSKSEKVKIKDEEFVRVTASFTGGNTGCILAIVLDGAGVVEVNAPQFEMNASANSYNMLLNNEVQTGTGWNLQDGSFTEEDGFYWYGALKIEGDPNNKKTCGQAVAVKSDKATRETFKLSAWAKGYALPKREDDEESPAFRLRAVFNYKDGTSTEKPTIADFCPNTSEWQLASVEFAKDAFKEVQNLEIFCDYDYNSGVAYFDNFELVRTSIETGLTEEDFASAETDQDQTEDETDVNETEEPIEASDEFEELSDDFGNTLTETTYTDGEYGTVYRSFGFDEDGNNLVKETDARGNITEYTVNGVTSRNDEVADRLGNKTVYGYDASGRIISVANKTKDGKTVANVSYTYDSFDNLTEIVRGDGLKYQLKYNAFRNLESIGIDGKNDGNLITYAYKTGSGRLNGMTYANGDKMTATYNGDGEMIAENWVDKNGNEIAHYQYGYNSQGEIVRTIDILSKKMYNYTYDNGCIEQALESDVTFNDVGFVDSKTIISTIRYYYDNEGTLIKKRIIHANGEQVITYQTADNDSQLVKTTVGEHSFVSTSKTDSFGRKEFDELQLGSGFVSRKFDYLNGSITEEHKDNKLLKSTPTTQLVSEITFSDGRTIDYEFDAEERITKVTDSVEGVTEYTYDALGQLLTESKNGQLINAMTYDNYGNFLTKNGIGYSYNGVWKDRLSHYDGKEIIYDQQGNPINYLGHILFWEKGRQLKSFDNSLYTYNANGIRTSKTVDGIRHDFYLDGGKILKELWNNNVLETVFDNEDNVCGIVYNGTPYYFQKNLQGDIIAITDKDGEVVARYTYDAWGKCTVDPASQNAVIAAVNPFRYRGYYYDSEIGMYYLQSRYYDPEVGRFLNGDAIEFAVFEQDVLTHNLFGYCNSSPILKADYLGTDAIILQSMESVFGFGHMGLLVEYKRNWYYWYWGLNGMIAGLQYAVTALQGLGATVIASGLGSATVVLGMLAHTVVRTLTKTVLAKAILKKVCNSKQITSTSTLSTINSKLKNANVGYDAIFEKGLFLRGDFSKSLKYLKTQKAWLRYNLIFNNCMQTSISALYRGKFKNNNIRNLARLFLARNFIVPKFAYNYLKNYFTSLMWRGRRK